ncbi:MAG: DUF99 family protein [Thermoplasmata archaeon]|nr:DUF99 family protein [Thermoplasmata archaeon]
MKEQVRVLGLDDGPFAFGDATVAVVGVVVRLPAYVEGVLVTEVEVDGTDATDRIVEILRASRFRKGLALIMVDGVAFGGFNVVDIARVHQETGVPTMTVTRKEPDLDAMERALRAKFADWEARALTIRRTPLERVETPHNPLFVLREGIGAEDARDLIQRSTVRGALPEPLRIAHLMATALKVGESKGSS